MVYVSSCFHSDLSKFNISNIAGLYRTLTVHLQICWDISTGYIFMFISLISGWGIATIGLSLALVVSGVSYRLGDVCFISPHDNLQTFWAPLILCASLSLILQLATFIYCLQVFLTPIFDVRSGNFERSKMASTFNNIQRLARVTVLQRVWQVIKLQWRGIGVNSIIFVNVISSAVIGMSLDRSVYPKAANELSLSAWLQGFTSSRHGQKQSASFDSKLEPQELVVAAVLILHAVSGMWFSSQIKLIQIADSRDSRVAFGVPYFWVDFLWSHGGLTLRINGYCTILRFLR